MTVISPHGAARDHPSVERIRARDRTLSDAAQRGPASRSYEERG